MSEHSIDAQPDTDEPVTVVAMQFRQSQTVRHHIEGWEPPKWATEHEIDGTLLHWSRASSDTTIGNITPYLDQEGNETYGTVEPALQRDDRIAMDAMGGLVTVTVGDTLIWVADDLEMFPAEARKLAAALVELADAAEAGR